MTKSSLAVLVVSDDPHLSSEIVYAFPDHVGVSFAHDAREAWSSMSDFVPSIVVLDLRAGSAGGYGLARDMEANDRLRAVPRLILLERPQDGWLAGQAGASAYRVKPIPTDELVEETLALAAGAAPS
ncbi:MAG: hypothetical protein ACRDK3_03825 [Actinomycetota bacterium]